MRIRVDVVVQKTVESGCQYRCSESARIGYQLVHEGYKTEVSYPA